MECGGGGPETRISTLVRGHVRRRTEEHVVDGAEERRGPGGAAERVQEGVEGTSRAVGHAEEGHGGDDEATVACQGGQQAVLVA